MAKKPNLVTSNSCPGCGKDFESPQAVRGHLRFCPNRQAVVGKQPPAPAFVAEVKPQPAPVAAPAAAAPAQAAEPSAAPAFVAQVDAPPPPPAPPAATEETQYVPRMPLPNPQAGTGGVPLEQWHAGGAFPNRLEELHPEPPAQAQLQAAAGTVSVATVGAPAAPGAQLAQVESATPAVDVVKVMQVLSKRMFQWEGGGPLTDEECELLRTVITWQPGPTSGAALILAGVFGPRLLTHPKVADAMGRLFDAGIDRLVSELGGDEAKPAAPPAREERPDAAASMPASVAQPVAVRDPDDELRAEWAARGVDLDEVRRAKEAA